MSTSRWPLVAITVAWLFAAVTIFLSGKWVGETNVDGPSYSDCRPISWTGRTGWLCFTDDQPIVNTPAEVSF